MIHTLGCPLFFVQGVVEEYVGPHCFIKRTHPTETRWAVILRRYGHWALVRNNFGSIENARAEAARILQTTIGIGEVPHD